MQQGPSPRHEGANTVMGSHRATRISDASGVRPKAAPGGPGRPNRQHRRSGNRRRRDRQGGATAARERAEAVVSALVRTLLHGAVRSAVAGAAGTGDAWNAAPSSERGRRPRRRRRQPGTRRGAKRAAGQAKRGVSGTRTEARGIPARSVETALAASTG